MKVFPDIRLTFRSSSTHYATTQRIVAMIAPDGVHLKRPPAPFRGFMRGTHFEAERILPRFSIKAFQPIITGDVVPTSHGTEVRVRMHLHRAIWTLVIICFGFVLMAGVLTVLSTTGHRGIPPGSTEAPFGAALAAFAAAVLLAYGSISIAFWAEVKKARSLLCEGLGVRDSDVRED